MGEFFINLLNAIIKALGIVLGWILNILPSSPFAIIDNSDVSEFISSLNWIIPINSIISILEVWLVAVIGYYIVMVVLRWVKAIE